MKKNIFLFLCTILTCWVSSAQLESELNPKDLRLFKKAIKSYSEKKFDKALELTERCLESEKLAQLDLVYLLRGEIYYAKRDYASAKDAYLETMERVEGSGNISERAQIGIARSMVKLEKSSSKEKEVEESKKEKSIAAESEDEQTKSDENVAFSFIEQVPIYPGCEEELTNMAHKKCMQKAITQHVSENFNTGLARIVGLKGKININVQFKIDKQGTVTNVYATALSPLLEEEAIRVIERLPKMTPGTQKGKPVGVLYGLPIIFEVE